MTDDSDGSKCPQFAGEGNGATRVRMHRTITWRRNNWHVESESKTPSQTTRTRMIKGGWQTQRKS
jgi:hypothetical protein